LRGFGTWTFQLNYAWGGLDERGYHAVNIAIHLAAACVLFDLVRRTLQLGRIPAWLAAHARWLSVSAALVWLAHPLQTQSVTYIIQRYESLMGLCYLLVLYCVLRGAQRQQAQKPRPLVVAWWYAAAFVACWAGAATKEVMVTAPLVALLFDRAYLAGSWKQVFRRRWALHVVLLVPIGWLLYINADAILVDSKEAGVGFGYKGITAWEYLRSQPAVLLHYLRLIVWPDVLTLDYGWPVETSPWRIYGLGAIIVVLVGVSLWLTFTRPRVGVLALSPLLILAPTSSIVPIADLIYEHRVYLPLAGVVVLALVGLARIVSAISARTAWKAAEGVPYSAGRLLWAVTAAVVALLAARTIIRNYEYRDPIALWEQMAARNAMHPRHFTILGKYYQDAGRRSDAIAAFERSVSLKADDHYVWTEYGNLYFEERDFDRAIALYRRAIQIHPQSFRAHANIGRSELIRGNYAAALAASRDALACVPTDPVVTKQVAWLLATAPDDNLRNGAEALRLAESLPQDPRHVDIQWQEVHAAALAELGRFDQAVIASERAVAAAQSISSKRVGQLQAQLASYRAGQPWRLNSPRH
jgi:tetratricopeptide (TPR) repeat protein